MSGEVTLRGRVLPIGGVKEKLLAARRAGVREVILPKKNSPSLKDLPEYVKEDMIIHFVNDVDEAIRIALVVEPTALCAPTFLDQPILPLFSEEPGQYALNIPGAPLAGPARCDSWKCT
jgi:ATP-dependent Lon protease